MNAPTGKLTGRLDLSSCKHWSNDLPYRAIIAVSIQQMHGTVLYQVAGLEEPPRNAINALKSAISKHGGICFYCRKEAAAVPSTIDFTIDHIEPIAIGGDSALTNLVVACKPCNQKKGQTPIDAFNAHATKEWLLALKQQVETRLAKLKANS